MQIGDKYGNLTVIDFENNYAVCKCDCGNIKHILKSSLTKKKFPTKSCGCLQKQIASNTGYKTIYGNSKNQIDRNLEYNTNFQVISQDTPPVNNTSGVKGVSWDRNRNAWEAYIGLHGKRIHLGRYAKFEDAVKARIRAEEEYYHPLLDELTKK